MNTQAKLLKYYGLYIPDKRDFVIDFLKYLCNDWNMSVSHPITPKYSTIFSILYCMTSSLHGIFLTACLLLISSFLSANNPDSLERVYSSGTASLAEKIKLCDDLSWEYLSYDFEKARTYATAGIQLAEKPKDLVMAGTLYRNLGVAYYMVSRHDSALYFLNKALDLGVQEKNDLLRAQAFAAIANVYNITGEYTKALEFYLKALPVFEKAGRKDRMRVIIGNIGALHNAMHNFDEAEKFFNKSLKISEDINDLKGIAQAYDGLNRVYIQRHDYVKALDYGLKAAAISHEIGNKQEEAIALQGVAWVYYEHFKDYENAEKYALQGLKLARELEFPSDIAAMLNTLSNIFFHQQRYRECEQAALEAIRTDTTDMNIYSNLAANLVRAGIHLGKREEALYYFDRYRQIFNIQSNKEFQQSLSDMQVKYETEKKQKEIIRLSAEKRERTLLVYSLLGLLLILTGLAFSIFYNIRKNKIIVEQQLIVKEQQLAEMEKERQLLATRSVLEGEESERARLANNLHDGLGGLLSGVKLNLSSMKENAIITSQNAEAFDHALSLLDHSIQELRRVAHNLMPETLYHYGLKPALLDFVNELKALGSPALSFQCFGDTPRYPAQLETTVYRIGQELVNNALKHSKAQNIDIQLFTESDRICLQVIDNGVGFDQDNSHSDGKGLLSIRNRVAAASGRFEIESKPGEGTEVTVEFLVS